MSISVLNINICDICYAVTSVCMGYVYAAKCGMFQYYFHAFFKIYKHDINVDIFMPLQVYVWDISMPLNMGGFNIVAMYFFNIKNMIYMYFFAYYNIRHY